jgi:hypothetical protein
LAIAHFSLKVFLNAAQLGGMMLWSGHKNARWNQFYRSLSALTRRHFRQSKRDRPIGRVFSESSEKLLSRQSQLLLQLPGGANTTIRNVKGS